MRLHFLVAIRVLSPREGLAVRKMLRVKQPYARSIAIAVTVAGTACAPHVLTEQAVSMPRPVSSQASHVHNRGESSAMNAPVSRISRVKIARIKSSMAAILIHA